MPSISLHYLPVEPAVCIISSHIKIMAEFVVMKKLQHSEILLWLSRKISGNTSKCFLINRIYLYMISEMSKSFMVLLHFGKNKALLWCNVSLPFESNTLAFIYFLLIINNNIKVEMQKSGESTLTFSEWNISMPSKKSFQQFVEFFHQNECVSKDAWASMKQYISKCYCHIRVFEQD